MQRAVDTALQAFGANARQRITGIALLPDSSDGAQQHRNRHEPQPTMHKRSPINR